MKILARQYGTIMAIHFTATLAAITAMWKFFIFDHATPSQQIINKTVYALYVAMLQPLASIFIFFPRLTARIPDGWLWAGSFVVVNSMITSALMLFAWKGLRALITKRPTIGSSVPATRCRVR